MQKQAMKVYNSMQTHYTTATSHPNAQATTYKTIEARPANEDRVYTPVKTRQIITGHSGSYQQALGSGLYRVSPCQTESHVQVSPDGHRLTTGNQTSEKKPTEFSIRELDSNQSQIQSGSCGDDLGKQMGRYESMQSLHGERTSQSQRLMGHSHHLQNRISGGYQTNESSTEFNRQRYGQVISKRYSTEQEMTQVSPVRCAQIMDERSTNQALISNKNTIQVLEYSNPRANNYSRSTIEGRSSYNIGHHKSYEPLDTNTDQIQRISMKSRPSYVTNCEGEPQNIHIHTSELAIDKFDPRKSTEALSIKSGTGANLLLSNARAKINQHAADRQYQEMNGMTPVADGNTMHEMLLMKDMHSLMLHRECQALAGKIVELEACLKSYTDVRHACNTESKCVGTDTVESSYNSRHCVTCCCGGGAEIGKYYSFSGENVGDLNQGKTNGSCLEDSIACMLRYEIASKDKLLEDNENIISDHKSTIAKLTSDLMKLGEFVNKELETYSNGMITMRDAMSKMRHEGKDRSRRMNVASTQTDGIRDIYTGDSNAEIAQYFSFSGFCDAKVFSCPIQAIQIQKMSTEVTKHTKIQECKPRIPIKRQFKESKYRASGVGESSRSTDSLATCKKNSDISSTQIKLIAKDYIQIRNNQQFDSNKIDDPSDDCEDSGFLSLSKVMDDSYEYGVQPIKIPRIDTVGLKKVKAQPDPITSNDTKRKMSSDQERSDSLFISQKIGEENHPPLTNEESFEDRFAKIRMIKEFVQTMPL